MAKDKQYQKEVKKYKWFVVHVPSKKVESGFESKDDAKELIRDFSEPKEYKVVALRGLTKLGIEDPREKWVKMEQGGGISKDRKFVSDEPHELRYLPNRKTKAKVYKTHEQGGGVGKVYLEEPVIDSHYYNKPTVTWNKGYYDVVKEDVDYYIIKKEGANVTPTEFGVDDNGVANSWIKLNKKRFNSSVNSMATGGSVEVWNSGSGVDVYSFIKGDEVYINGVREPFGMVTSIGEKNVKVRRYKDGKIVTYAPTKLWITKNIPKKEYAKGGLVIEYSVDYEKQVDGESDNFTKKFSDLKEALAFAEENYGTVDYIKRKDGMDIESGYINTRTGEPMPPSRIYRLSKGGGVGEDMTEVEKYFNSIDYSTLPEPFSKYIKEEILTDPDLKYLSEKEPIFVEIKEKIESYNNKKKATIEVIEESEDVVKAKKEIEDIMGILDISEGEDLKRLNKELEDLKGLIEALQ